MPVSPVNNVEPIKVGIFKKTCSERVNPTKNALWWKLNNRLCRVNFVRNDRIAVATQKGERSCEVTWFVETRVANELGEEMQLAWWKLYPYKQYGFRGYLITLSMSLILLIGLLTGFEVLLHHWKGSYRLPSSFSAVQIGLLVGIMMCVNSPMYDDDKPELQIWSVLIVAPWVLLGAVLGACFLSRSTFSFWSPFFWAFVHIFAYAAFVVKSSFGSSDKV